jgi:PAS domain S-box-containing protein
MLDNQPVESETADELYEHAPCGYLSALTDGSIVRVNQTLLNWTGYSRDALLGRRLRDLLPLPGRIFYETHYDPLLRMQGFIREMSLELVCATGRHLPVLINSTVRRESSGGQALVWSTVFDATERRTYEKELLAARRRAEQLAAVVESSADAIAVISPDGVVQTWNRGAERLFGYCAAEVVGGPVQDLIVPNDRRAEFEQAIALVRAGQQMQLETVRLHKDGTRLDVSVGYTPHIEAPNELVAISAITRDVTERRRIEARLRQTEQLQSVSTLAGGVAHEVNNQMAVVLGFGEFVLKALGGDHPQAPDVKAIVAAAAKAAGISQQLLAFSRQLPSVRRALHLSRWIEEQAPRVAQLLGSERILNVEAAGEEALVSADPAQLEQILFQLTSNARDAMSAGDRLTIATSIVSLSEEDAKANPGDDVAPGRYVLLAVTDTGTGMDSATLGRAFEPFFTTKPFGGGTGLGLAVVHGIVKQHGGHLWASSEPGKGTSIHLYFPAEEQCGTSIRP